MAPKRRSLAGFTLIELLVVIAIIAILTAILLPVFASVRENSRQSVSISNMKDIQQKMEQYKLDYHKYPDVLFGYAYPNSTMQTGLGMAQADDKIAGTHFAEVYFPGLYPAYIKDPNVFTDPNNNIDVNAAPANQITPALDAYVVAPCNPINDAKLSQTASTCATATSGDAVPTKRLFYTRDAYDVSPVVTGGNSLNTSTLPFVFLTRYQTARLPTGTADADYNKQLRWRNPPAETVVTATTYHVPNADKVLVLFASGAVKKMKAEDFLAKEGAANFWRVAP